MIGHESQGKISLETSEIKIWASELRFRQNYSQTERLGITNPTTPNRLNPSPNEFRSRTRSAVGRFKPRFRLPNGLQTGQTYSRIERLDEMNPASPRTQNSDISKDPRPKLEGIKGEIKDRSCPFAPPRPPPEFCRTTAGPPFESSTFCRTTAGPPPEGPTFCRTTADHHLKALLSAGPPPKGPTLCRTTT
ncbi:hypothetical protein M5K25_021515 [Dendrobium thyrsiflorum]|uniref:Uncharacterized protein n=1 Tax=Dendrobium thyrsiflorum TaxID=117978 RepID=A0ABD0UD11_DENTH